MRFWIRALLLGAYVAVAIGTTWPLARHFGTHLTGDVGGDTGVYVWNLWIFRHEILGHGQAPFSTDHVFAFADGDDFTLHNYTPVAGAVAAPLIGVLGLIPTFNLILLALIVSVGLCTYALARQAGLERGWAWLAGALFAASPVLLAKETAHFSLVAAAPLPLFLWALFRTLDTARWKDAVLVGAIVAWANYSDAYYGVYCTLMGLFVLAWRGLRIDVPPPADRRPLTVVARVLDVLLIVVGATVAWRVLSGSTGLMLGVSIRTLYTPVLVLWVLAVARLWIVWQPVIRRQTPGLDLARLWRPGVVAVVAAVWFMAPLFVGLAVRAMNGELPATKIFWRSSPRGVDLLAYLAPNPSNPLFGATPGRLFLPDLVAGQPDPYPEYVAAFPLVALAVIGYAAWRRRLPAFWVAFTLFFVALSLGPFLYVGGALTYLPGPWAFLRYVPGIEMARTPSRFAIVAALGLSMLSAFALRELAAGARTSRRLLVGGIVALLAIEVSPIPRHMYSAAVPDVYRVISAASDESGRVLELPTGLRDGTSSLGDFGPQSQYFQTRHHHPLIGGYLSRVSPGRRRTAMRAPMMRALLTLSQQGTLTDEERANALAARDAFLRKTCTGFVVIDRDRATPELVEFAKSAIGLDQIHQDEHFALFVPRNPPPCERPIRR